jgi:hypothetical protein
MIHGPYQKPAMPEHKAPNRWAAGAEVEKRSFSTAPMLGHNWKERPADAHEAAV